MWIHIVSISCAITENAFSTTLSMWTPYLFLCCELVAFTSCSTTTINNRRNINENLNAHTHTHTDTLGKNNDFSLAATRTHRTTPTTIRNFSAVPSLCVKYRIIVVAAAIVVSCVSLYLCILSLNCSNFAWWVVVFFTLVFRWNTLAWNFAMFLLCFCSRLVCYCFALFHNSRCVYRFRHQFFDNN